MLSGNPCAPAQICHLNVCTGALSSAILRTPVPATENVQGFKSWKAEMTPTTQVGGYDVIICNPALFAWVRMMNINRFLGMWHAQCALPLFLG